MKQRETFKKIFKPEKKKERKRRKRTGLESIEREETKIF